MFSALQGVWALVPAAMCRGTDGEAVNELAGGVGGAGASVTGWVGFAWGTDNSLRNSPAVSDHLESLFFSSISIEFALVLMTIRS